MVALRLLHYRAGHHPRGHGHGCSLAEQWWHSPASSHGHRLGRAAGGTPHSYPTCSPSPAGGRAPPDCVPAVPVGPLVSQGQGAHGTIAAGDPAESGRAVRTYNSASPGHARVDPYQMHSPPVGRWEALHQAGFGPVRGTLPADAAKWLGTWSTWDGGGCFLDGPRASAALSGRFFGSCKAGRHGPLWTWGQTHLAVGDHRPGPRGRSEACILARSGQDGVATVSGVAEPHCRSLAVLALHSCAWLLCRGSRTGRLRLCAMSPRAAAASQPGRRSCTVWGRLCSTGCLCTLGLTPCRGSC